MKHLLLLITIVITTSFAFGQTTNTATQNNKELERVLMQLQREQDEAEIKRDMAKLERIFTDDQFATYPMGNIQTKTQYINSLKERTPSKTDQIKYDDVRVNTYGNTAIVNYVVTFSNSSEKDTPPRKYRNTVVWVKQGNDWKTAATHASAFLTPINRSVAKVDPKILDTYVGEYESAPNQVLTITRENDKLMGRFPNAQKAIELLPENETTFYVKQAPPNVLIFVKDNNGKVSHILYRLISNETKSKKIK